MARHYKGLTLVGTRWCNAGELERLRHDAELDDPDADRRWLRGLWRCGKAPFTGKNGKKIAEAFAQAAEMSPPKIQTNIRPGDHPLLERTKAVIRLVSTSRHHPWTIVVAGPRSMDVYLRMDGLPSRSAPRIHKMIDEEHADLGNLVRLLRHLDQKKKWRIRLHPSVIAAARTPQRISIDPRAK